MMKIINMKQRVGVGVEMSTTTNKNKIRESLMRRPCKSMIYIIRSPEDRTWRMLKKKKKNLMKIISLQLEESYSPQKEDIYRLPHQGIP